MKIFLTLQTKSNKHNLIEYVFMSMYLVLFIQNNQKTQFIGNFKNLQNKKLILPILKKKETGY